MSSIFIHALVVAGGTTTTVITGVSLSRHWARKLKGTAFNDVLSTYVSVIGTLYAVLLAFVLVSVWEQYDTAQGAAEREASQMTDLVRLTPGLPQNSGAQVRAAIHEYASAVIDDEWDRMQEGGHSVRVDRALDQLWQVIVANPPIPGSPGAAIYSQALARLTSTSDSRRDRLSQARPSVQGVIWVLLIGAGALTLISTYFFEASASIYLPVNAGLTLMIAFILYLVFAFDHPFGRDVGMAPDAMQSVLDMVK